MNYPAGMDARAQAAIDNLQRAVEKMKASLARVPDGRIDWQPSSTARSPLHLVAHSAFAIEFIRQLILGTPYAASTMEQADADFLLMESEITTREQVTKLIDENCSRYIDTVGQLTDSQLESEVDAPFGLGKVPVWLAITFGGLHTQLHQAQLEYVQTIYGDRAW